MLGLTQVRTAVGDESLADVFGRIAAQLTGARTVDEVLSVLTRRAIEVIPSADHAAITQARRGGFETVAATSDVPALVDTIQFAIGSGPGLDAIGAQTASQVDDLAAADRWPQFGMAAAQRYDVHSLLTVPIRLPDADRFGALTLYAHGLDAFGASDATVAALLATHGATALAAAFRLNKVDNLERALHSSRRIGIAIGVLMTTRKVTDAQAFDLLRSASQVQHRRLADIAEDVVQTGALEPAHPARHRLG